MAWQCSRPVPASTTAEPSASDGPCKLLRLTDLRGLDRHPVAGTLVENGKLLFCPTATHN
jgi:hypothetical protein